MNKHIGFPACPFAAKWRKDNKLRIEVRLDKTKYEKHLTNVIKDWNKKQHDIIIFCDPYWDQYDEEQFQEKIDFYISTRGGEPFTKWMHILKRFQPRNISFCAVCLHFLLENRSMITFPIVKPRK